MERMDRKVNYKIEAHVGVLESYPNGWAKEVNLVSWNGGPVKIDIRDWSKDHTGMSKGVTLFDGEAAKLKRYLEYLPLD